MRSQGTEISFITSLQCVLVTHPSISFVFVDERISTSRKKGLLRMNCQKSNTFLISRLSANKSLMCYPGHGLCHRGNKTRTPTNVSGPMICATYTEIDGEPTEDLEDTLKHYEELQTSPQGHHGEKALSEQTGYR